MKVYRVGGSVIPPRSLSTEQPHVSSDPNRPVGTVIIWAIIDTSGNVRYPRIIAGLGTVQDAEAIKVVKQRKFEPSTKQGAKVAIQTNLTVRSPSSSVAAENPQTPVPTKPPPSTIRFLGARAGECGNCQNGNMIGRAEG